MALLSGLDVLLFFSLLLNAVAITKPARGSAQRRNAEDGGAATATGSSRPAAQAGSLIDIEDVGYDEDTRDTTPLIASAVSSGPSRRRSPSAPSTWAAAGATTTMCGELLERLARVLQAFRRCGVLIAIWNTILMFAMAFFL